MSDKVQNTCKAEIKKRLEYADGLTCDGVKLELRVRKYFDFFVKLFEIFSRSYFIRWRNRLKRLYQDFVCAYAYVIITTKSP